MKQTKFHTFLIEALNGKEIDDLDAGITSKRILFKMTALLNEEEHKELKERILKMNKINIEIAKRILRDEQKKSHLKKIKDTVNNK